MRGGALPYVRRRSRSAGCDVDGLGDGDDGATGEHEYCGDAGSKSLTGVHEYSTPAGSVYVHPAGGDPGEPSFPSVPSLPS